MDDTQNTGSPQYVDPLAGISPVQRMALQFQGPEAIDNYIKLQQLSQLKALADQAQNGSMQPLDVYGKANAITGDPTNTAQRQAVSGYYSNLPQGTNNMQALSGLGNNLAATTGDLTTAQKMPQMIMELAEKQSAINKNNADTAHTQSQTFTTPAGGALSPGQKAVDDEFAKTFTTFNNSGGANNTNVALKQIDSVIGQLQNGQLNTGRLAERAGFDAQGHANIAGRMIDPDVAVQKNNLDSAVTPLLKPLFGARITNFDASSMMNSMGLNPQATNEQNIAKLNDLKQRLLGGQQELYKAGSHFNQYGTLAGYGGATGENQQQQAQQGAQQPQQPAAGGYAQKVLQEIQRRHSGGQ